MEHARAQTDLDDPETSPVESPPSRDARAVFDAIAVVDSLDAAAVVTYSPSWTLIPTHWCRNTCGYCVFVERTGERAGLLAPGAARVEIERARAAGATELLIMSGEGVEESRAVRDALKAYGCASYTDYLTRLARLALARDILPHVNVGNLTEDEFRALSPCVPSSGMMLETIDDSPGRTAAHRRAPDKRPERRLETLRAAGRVGVPFTTGLLVGIGEQPGAREATLYEIAAIQRRYGHIQEVIVQPFTPHAGTPMEHCAPPAFAELRATVEMARAILPAEVSVQIPPNLAPRFVELIRAGAHDLGGVSPDGDRINPAERWLAPASYARALRAHGFTLRPRLAVHDRWISPRWFAPGMLAAIARAGRRLPRASSRGCGAQASAYA